MIPLSPIATLAQRCAEETEKYRAHLPSDPQFCFDLMRRTFVDLEPDGFTYVVHAYESLVMSWVHRHQRFQQTGESAEYFAGAAFRAFYFALRGPKFTRFPTLPAVLTYLKMCVHTAITQHLRDGERLETVPISADVDPAATPDLTEDLEAVELWTHVCRLLPDERDRLLARCVFVVGLKPREICVAYRAYWSSERDVSVALYRLRRLLRADEGLRSLAGLTQPT